MERENYNVWFIVYLVVFILTFLLLSPYIILDPDNGTHAVLSLFYRNLFDSVANSIIKGDGLSFQRIYNFGVSYLVHYPKLQVFYPPLYHLVTGIVFYTIFGVSAWSAGFCNLVFAVLAMCTLYALVMKLFDSKTALIAVVLFSLFPYMFTLTGRAMMEHTAMFFLFLSLFTYLEINDSKNASKRTLSYVLLAVIAVLSVLSKRAAIFVLPVYFLHLLYKKKWKYAAVFLVASALLLAPYGLIIWKVDGLGISSTIWQRYAFEKFVWYFFFEYPFLFVFFCSFAYYLWRSKDENKSLFCMWFAVFLVGMLLISFKYRYFTYFLIPTFIVTANYLSKRYKVWILLFLFTYLLFSVYIMLPTLVYYPIERIARSMYDNAQSGSGIAMLSEGDYFYSSALMFYVDKFDEEISVRKDLFVYRPCAFFGMEKENIEVFFNENNIFYVVAVPGENGYETLEGVKHLLEQTRSGYVEVYKVKNFEMTELDEYCNTVCLTEETICTDYATPYDVYS